MGLYTVEWYGMGRKWLWPNCSTSLKISCETTEHNGKPQSEGQTENRNEYFPNKSLGRYSYINLLAQVEYVRMEEEKARNEIKITE
jgi:hypothetical protein